MPTVQFLQTVLMPHCVMDLLLESGQLIPLGVAVALYFETGLKR